jgi:hypothetical protein
MGGKVIYMTSAKEVRPLLLFILSGDAHKGRPRFRIASRSKEDKFGEVSPT